MLSKILELGSGTGIVGMSLSFLLKPQKTLITDLDFCVSIIKDAYDLNKSIL